MAYTNRIKPEDYSSIVAAFGQVGAPIFARVGAILDKQRAASGNGKRIAFVTLKKAWDKGWEAQIGGAPAPAIKTLFPSWVLTAPTPEPTNEPEPVHPESKPPAVLPGASPVGLPDAASQARNAERQLTDPKVLTKELDTSMVGTTSADALTVLDPLHAAILKLDEGRATALLNEMGILAAARQNIRGLQDIANVVISTLAGRHDILKRLVGDLAHTDAATLRTVRDTLKELGGVLKDLAATNKAIQESQRLLVGMPQRIEERRGSGHGGEDFDDRTLGRMANMLRTRLEAADKYDGEETGDVQEAEFVDGAAPTENASAPGQEQANNDEPTT